MKNFNFKYYVLFFAALVMALNFSSCKKDEEEDDDLNEQNTNTPTNSTSQTVSLGTWFIKEFKVDGEEQGTVNEKWVFNEGKFKGYFPLFEDIINCNYKYSDGKLVMGGGDLVKQDGNDVVKYKVNFNNVQKDASILILSGIFSCEVNGVVDPETYDIYVRLDKDGNSGGDNGNSNVNASDFIGTWYVKEYVLDGDDLTEDYRNESWIVDESNFYGDLYDGYATSPYTYRNGKLTIDVYSWTDGDDYGSLVFEFTNIILNGSELTLSGRVTSSGFSSGSPYSEEAPLSIKLTKNQQPPVSSYTEGSFEWERQGGGSASGLDEFGLEWRLNNQKAVYAVIKPLTGATLYILNSNDYAATSLADINFPAESTQYKGVNVELSTGTYDDVIATEYNGKTYLIHVTGSSSVQEVSGLHSVITGTYKRFD